ncbi:5426_t:CDS:2, partial [Gigaspora margarita]
NELGKEFCEYKGAKEYYRQSKLCKEQFYTIRFPSVKEGLECHHSEEDLDDKNKSDPDDYRINKIQQGIDIDKEKLKNKMITI